MPRVRWCPLPVLCLFVYSSLRIAFVTADCWYDEKRYPEVSSVETLEPCLNCTCTRGVLLCYLRVCPKLPNPPPPGCILLHRYKTCCPELICTDLITGENDIEGRSEPEGMDLEIDRSLLRNGCLANGTVYSPGSAMSTSSICEYCYCLGGRQRCVKPRCLLPTEGCTPIYETHTCCPVHYNCTRTVPSKPTTTTETPEEIQNTVGCVVSGKFYPEGKLVLGVGHSACDNCYCIRGMLRCEPLSCAPPLLGCTPVIKPGECCAASYNCSGTIETNPEPNYGQFPIVSKEYAQLRKVNQQKHTMQKPKPNLVVENDDGVLSYVIAESSNVSTTKVHRSPGNYGTTRHFIGNSYNPTTKSPGQFKIVYYATTNYEFQNKNYKRPISTTYRPRLPNHAEYKTVNSINVEGIPNSHENVYESPSNGHDHTVMKRIEDVGSEDVFYDGRLTRKEDNVVSMGISEEITTEFTTEEGTSEVTVNEHEITFTTETVDMSTTTQQSEMDPTTDELTTEPGRAVTFRTIKNSTDCVRVTDQINERHNIQPATLESTVINDINNLKESTKSFQEEYTSTEISTTDASTQADVAEVDLEFKVNVDRISINPVTKLSPIDNQTTITKSKDDGADYDYNDLPPSLPNLKIIPFVAADALDSRKEILKENSLVHERVTEPSLFSYTNLFSPPIETEGGFVPKNPSILDTFYENSYFKPGPAAISATQNSKPAMTTTPMSNEHSCMTNGQTISHGEPVASDSPCLMCLCLFGNIVCHQPQCPVAESGCRLTDLQKHACCPSYICENSDAPPALLDRLDVTSIPKDVIQVAEEAVPPFRDVIRTEPAPDLSLLPDVVPFLTTKPTPLLKPTKTLNETQTQNNTSDDYGSIFLNKIFGLFSDPETLPGTEIPKGIQRPESPTADRKCNCTEVTSGDKEQQSGLVGNFSTEYSHLPTHPNSVDSTAGVGLLKLAGCNIYGRMYRVGRIISELSGPCTECRCTEIGVQCRALGCD